MIVAMEPQTWWWFTRATGMIAWVIVTASVVWGLLVSARLVRRRGVPAWLLDLHRYLGTLAIVFTGFHLVTLVADRYVHFGTRQLFVPMASTWRPGPVAWGIVAFYALVVVQVTSWLMTRLPRKLWHRAHMLSIVVFVAGTVHGFAAGTDRTNRLIQAGAVIGATWALSLTTLRLLAREARAPAPASAGVPVAADERAARLAALANRRAQRGP